MIWSMRFVSNKNKSSLLLLLFQILFSCIAEHRNYISCTS